jgi:hypothetical protein
MERNANDTFGSTQGSGQGGSVGGSSGGMSAGASGSTGGTGAGGSFGGSTGNTGTQGYGSTGASNVGGSTGGASGGSMRDEATSKVQQGKEAVSEKFGAAKDAAADKFGAVKEKATQLSATLADKLEAGAEKLRQRGQGGQLAGAGNIGGTAVVSDEKLSQYSNQLAGGLQGAADWLRDGDLKETIETQVKEHPGRTLLIALGVGYLVGKALRK